MALTSLKAQLQKLVIPISDPGLKAFVPEGVLANIFTSEILETVLREPAFKIPGHKVTGTAEIVIDEAPRIFAICLELNVEHSFKAFIEHDVTDSALPLTRSKLDSLAPGAAALFEGIQWKYVAYRFRKGPFHRTLQKDHILPYTSQKQIGGGGFSKVFRILVHPAHQNLIKVIKNGEAVPLIRKRLEPCRQSERLEAELLFLLGSIRHPNIVELLASYTQEGVSNLIFRPADCDLHEFLLRPTRPDGFEHEFVYLYAMRGLADGLEYLHNFGPRARQAGASLLHGCHHDIKPRNILVRGTSFILADFGFAKLKSEAESSQTLWKNTTFEYGAPECRDPDSFAPGSVGRALDIWSLACVFSELITYFEIGTQGVEAFRSHRLVEHRYGQIRCFHDGECLAPIVAEHLDALKTATHSSSLKQLLSFLQIMFSKEPKARLTARETQQVLSQVTLSSLVDAVLGSIQRSIDAYLQKSRLTAWAQVLGIKTQGQAFGHQQLYDFFDDFYRDLQATLEEFQVGNRYENIEDNHDFMVRILDQTNNAICKCLPKHMRKSIDDTFRVISVSTSELQPLQRMATLATDTEQLHDIRGLAAIRYMTLLVERHGHQPVPHSRIESSLIRETNTKTIDLTAFPDTRLYRYGYRPNEERPVIFELMPYWKRGHDPDSEAFQQAIKAMFRRVQELIAVLRYNARPVAFRSLDCLGAFHDPKRKGFGMIYAFPWEDTVPIRLNKLLRRSAKDKFVPDLSEKLDLAKILVTCVQSFHISGWVHKNISSFSVIFFLKSEKDLSTLNMREPYVIGFDHSRKDGEDEYSLRNSSRIPGAREYLHPDYRKRGTDYRRSYDYYSLGLVLLEIGTWTSLSNIYGAAVFPPPSPEELRMKYIRNCTEHLVKTMGPTYADVTKKCLEYDAGEDGVGEQLKFQAEVVDKLNRCMI